MIELLTLGFFLACVWAAVERGDARHYRHMYEQERALRDRMLDALAERRPSAEIIPIRRLT